MFSMYTFGLSHFRYSLSNECANEGEGRKKNETCYFFLLLHFIASSFLFNELAKFVSFFPLFAPDRYIKKNNTEKTMKREEKETYKKIFVSTLYNMNPLNSSFFFLAPNQLPPRPYLLLSKPPPFTFSFCPGITPHLHIAAFAAMYFLFCHVSC